MIGWDDIEFHYIYDKHRRLRGAIATDGTRTGYSYIHKHDLHKASKKLARRIAIGRMLTCYLVKDEFGNWIRCRNNSRTWVPREVYPYLEVL
jgi:hypothetical protein